MHNALLEALANEYTGKVTVVGVTCEDLTFTITGTIGSRTVKHSMTLKSETDIPEAARIVARRFRRFGSVAT